MHRPVRWPIRRLLPALLLACSVLVLPLSAASACTCRVPAVAQSSRQADVVFSGALLGEQRGRRQADLAFEVGRIYKGQVTAEAVDVASPTERCGLELVDEGSYLVFARDGRSGLVSDQCSGTTRAGSRAIAAVERALGPGEPYAEPTPQPEPEPEAEPEPGPAPEPVTPTYTRVLDAPPPEFPRAAAPGAALALVGLLGWFVVRRTS